MGRFAAALEDVRRIMNGNCSGVVMDTIRICAIPVFTPEEIRSLRHSAKMPQRVFAKCIGVTEKAVEAWEGGRSRPNGAVRRLLGMLAEDPDFFYNCGICTRQRTEYRKVCASSKKTRSTHG